MGTLERAGQKRAKRRNLKKAVLRALEIAAISGQAIQTRGIGSAIRGADALHFERNDWSAIARSRRQMLLSGLLYERNGNLHMTRKGREELARIEAAEALVKKPGRWDGRWRLLIFDIPEIRRLDRQKVRRTLLSHGFARLQDSVWVYPYDCEDYVALLKADLKIGGNLLYIIADEIEGMDGIKKQFGLR